MATSTPTTKEGWLALAQHYRDNAADYAGYPHYSWEYSQYTYWIGQAEYAEEQAAKFNTGGGGSSDPKLITGTSGNDTITNTLASATINAGAGNDSILSYGDRVIIYASSGNDRIHNGYYKKDYYLVSRSSSNDTIDGGEGNDFIENCSYNSSINGGFGDDTIKNGYDRLSSGTVVSGGAADTVEGGAGNDSIDNYAERSLINGGDGDDTINNGKLGLTRSGAVKSTIYGGNGNDDLWNSCDSVTMSGDNGDDVIFNNGNRVSLSGGNGNDTIKNYRTKGDDRSYGYYTTISGGAGNDLISLNGGGCLIQYVAGDGADIIYGFNGDSTLSIVGGTGDYPTTKSGSAIIVTVGNNEITLVGAASLSYLHINDSVTTFYHELDGFSFDSILITGTENGDSIKNSGYNVTINGGEGDDTIRSGYYSYTSSNGNSSHYGGDSAVIDGGAGNDSIRNSGFYSAVDGGDGNDSIINTGSNVTIKGGDGSDKVYNYAAYSLIDAGNDDDSIVNYFHHVSIDAGAGNDSIYNTDNYVTIAGGAGNDTISLSSYAENSLVEYSSGDGKDVVYGFNETTTLQIAASNYSTKKSGSNIIVTVGSGKITLLGAASLSSANINFDKIEWKLSGTTATYGTSSNTLITVNGVKSLDGISLSGTKVTLSETALGTDNVTISDGYKLALGKNVTKSSKTKAWSLNKTTATYKQTTTAGYTLADNAITYSPKSVETLATVKGVKAVEGLKISGKTITVSEASLNKKNVTVSDGYTLKLGSDVTKPITKKAAWNLSGSTATYKSSYKTAGYTLADNQISYAKATTATNLATVKGAKSADGLSVSGSKITLKNAALANKVTVSGGYEFDFAKDYTNATITGSKSNDTITARGTKVLINAGAGDDTIKMLVSTITVKGGSGNDLFVYSTGNNVIADYETGDKISIGAAISSSSFKDTDATFKIGSKTLTVKNGKGKEITFIDASGTERTIIGGAYLATNNTSSKVTLTASREVGDATARTNPIRLTGNAKDNTILGGSNDDSLYGGAGNDSLMGNAGNDLLSGGSGDDYVIGGDGNDKLYGYTGNDTLIGGAGNDSLWGQAGADTFVYSNGNDIIYGFDDNDMLTLDGLDFTASVENDAVTFTVNDAPIILKDFTATTFHVNGDTYAISNNKFVKQ